MRKEATLEQWRELYEVIGRLKTLEPWRQLWDLDLIAIQLDGADEPVYCSVMGRGETCYGVSFYEGNQGLADFQLACEAPDLGIPIDYAMFEHSCLTCYWGDREEVPQQQKKIIKELGLKFRGRGQWPYFLSFLKRFSPYTPDAREAAVICAAAQRLYEAVRALSSGRINVNWDDEEIILYARDKDTEEWEATIIDRPWAEARYPILELTDEVLKKRLQKAPYVDADIMLDFHYLNMAQKEKGDDRPRNPLVFLAVDADNEMIIDMHLLQPDEDEASTAFAFLIQFVQQYGRMALIRARNPWILAALDSICSACGISLVEDSLELVDEILEHVRTQL